MGSGVLPETGIAPNQPDVMPIHGTDLPRVASTLGLLCAIFGRRGVLEDSRRGQQRLKRPRESSRKHCIGPLLDRETPPGVMANVITPLPIAPVARGPAKFIVDPPDVAHYARGTRKQPPRALFAVRPNRHAPLLHPRTTTPALSPTMVKIALPSSVESPGVGAPLMISSHCRSDRHRAKCTDLPYTHAFPVWTSPTGQSCRPLRRNEYRGELSYKASGGPQHCSLGEACPSCDPRARVAIDFGAPGDSRQFDPASAKAPLDLPQGVTME
ncbi:hypothetical protein N7510_000627 [Penicillium lagena]|uniref:uncharacterized protein n=1 Tax=Penicillium lagena TaxID=94218 RepID=UPI00253FE497|nr:uncharacterized protein N7510_000627 [Penicillium lagena]KAJ5624318.1 hypothetical protein N7510_000627 [Penicillium lagena]